MKNLDVAGVLVRITEWTTNIYGIVRDAENLVPLHDLRRYLPIILPLGPLRPCRAGCVRRTRAINERQLTYCFEWKRPLTAQLAGLKQPIEGKQ